MRIFEINATQASEHPSLAPFLFPGACRASYLWLSVTRTELRESLEAVQHLLQTLCGTPLVDLHVSDLLNDQLPSHFDYTSQYDLLVIRRLAAGQADAPAPSPVEPVLPHRQSGPPALRRIDTRPVGFAVFERVLLSVHPEDGTVRDAVAAKLSAAATPASAPAIDVRATSARLPASPADLMLRVVNQIVDSYLALRRELTRQLDHWQQELIDPKTRFSNWAALMQSRQSLHHLDEICEDQRAAMQDWVDALEALPPPATAPAQRERDLLLVRSRDVLEHIERVVHHVHRLEQNAETAVQLHFNVQSHRTNDIMRVLTVLTAIFLPLNLIAGIFGMNFEFIPLVHKADGFWIAMGAMVLIAIALVLVFWRKRYLARTAR